MGHEAMADQKAVEIVARVMDNGSDDDEGWSEVEQCTDDMQAEIAQLIADESDEELVAQHKAVAASMTDDFAFMHVKKHADDGCKLALNTLHGDQVGGVSC